MNLTEQVKQMQPGEKLFPCPGVVIHLDINYNFEVTIPENAKELEGPIDLEDLEEYLIRIRLCT